MTSNEEGKKMAAPCTKEKEIEILMKSQSENRDLLIKLNTLVESLVQYQLKDAADKIKDHEIRIAKIESLAAKIVAWSAVGGIVGGAIMNYALKKL